MVGIFVIISVAVLWMAVIAVYPVPALIAFVLWVILVFFGMEKRAGKALGIVETTLMPEEKVLERAIQHRVFALLSRRRVLAITNSRIIEIARGWFGGFKMLDMQWKDLKDAKIEQNVLGNICGSNIKFDSLNTIASVPNARFLQLYGIPSDVASRVYSHAQFEEQAWEEKRRVRSIEEVRAAAGGVVVNGIPGGPIGEARSAIASGSMLEEIQKAKALLDSGAISDAEFQEIKAKILTRI